MLYLILHCIILLHYVELAFGIISLSMCSSDTTFGKSYLLPSSGDGRLIPILLGPIESANLSHWFLPSSVDRNRYSFRNGGSPKYFEFRSMKKVLKPSNSEYYSQLPEPFIFQHFKPDYTDGMNVRVGASHFSFMYSDAGNCKMNVRRSPDCCRIREKPVKT
jgi:hypothetical protein